MRVLEGNLHITTLGHGYASHYHVDHSRKCLIFSIVQSLNITKISVEMNLSHVINEFSFGPYFPDIVQPLDYSFEVAEDRK